MIHPHQVLPRNRCGELCGQEKSPRASMPWGFLNVVETRRIECPPGGRISARFLESRFFGYSSSYCTEKIVTRVRFRCSCFSMGDAMRFSRKSMSAGAMNCKCKTHGV